MNNYMQCTIFKKADFHTDAYRCSTKDKNVLLRVF